MNLLLNRYERQIRWTGDGDFDYEESVENVESDTVGVADAVKALQTCVYASSYPLKPDTMTGREWAETEEQMDPSGVSSRESVHISRADGQALTGRQLFRLFKLGGLVR